MPEKLPHICFVSPSAYPILVGDQSVEIVGGAELQQVLVARGMLERGYQVSMICLDFGQGSDVNIDGIRVLGAYKPHEGIPVMRFFWPRLTSLWSCLARVNADIYYQRCAGMLTGVVAAFCKRHGRKSVFAAANNPDLEKNTPMIRYARDRWIYEYGLRHVDRIFVQNDEQARLCRANFGRDPTLVPNCYPIQPERGISLGQDVLWVSTIRARKRPDLFLKLAAALPQYRFRMVGGPGQGEHRLFESVNERARAIPNVDFIGFVPYSRIDQHFDATSVFVNTAETEGFPNTFLQAWSRGIPTVSFFDCGARADGRPVGVLVDNMEEMARSLEALLADTAAAADMGAKCRAYFQANHSTEAILPLYEIAFIDLWQNRS